MSNGQYTNRGFRIYAELTDKYGSKIRVQESSLATDTCVWIFANNDKLDEPAPHLTVEQARQIADALYLFVAENDNVTPTTIQGGEE